VILQTPIQTTDAGLDLARAIIDTAFAMCKAMEGADLSQLGKTQNEINKAITKAAQKAAQHTQP
jgi:hypothetical protein